MAGQGMSISEKNIEEAYDGLSTDFTHALHSRESLLEAVIMASKFTSTLTLRQNEMLSEAIQDGRFSTCLGLMLPASIFVGGTFSTHRTGRIGVDMYSTFLPKPSKKALRKKTAGQVVKERGGGGANANSSSDNQNVEHTHNYDEYVSGDPKNINVPMQQASNLLHLFFTLQFMKNKYHDSISLGEEGINMTIVQYRVLVKRLMECTGVGNDTWSNLLDEYNGQTHNVPPWSPFCVEEIVDKNDPKRVVAYRFLVFMNVHLGPNIQHIFNQYIDELRERLVYNSECIAKVKEMCANLKKPPQPGQANMAAGMRGQGANLAAAAAAPQADEQNIHQQKMAKLIERCRGDYREAAKLLIGTQLRCWEIPLIEVIKDPYCSYFNGSTVLAKYVRTLQAAGDNISMPHRHNEAAGGRVNPGGVPDDSDVRYNVSDSTYAIGHEKLDVSGRFISAFARNPARRAATITSAPIQTQHMASVLVPGIHAPKYSRPSIREVMERVEQNSYLISQQKLFANCYYLPASEMQDYERGSARNPFDPSDPRRLEHLFHMLGTFSFFACTSADPKQLNPAAYFDLDNSEYEGEFNNVLPADTPAYVITTPHTPQHRKWHEQRENRPSITYGGLVNLIPQAYGIPFADMHRHFKGFPEEVVARGNVTIIWPTAQPWEFGMIPLPEVMRSVNMFSYAKALTYKMALNENSNATQFIDSMDSTDPLSIACLYMVTVMSVDTLLIDSNKTREPITQLPIRTEVDANKRYSDLARDRISIPESCQTLGYIFNVANGFLTRRRQSARMNITFNHKVPTRIAYETGQPVVRQPNDPMDAGVQNATTALDRETFVLGMDVYHYAGETNGQYLGLVEVMCGSVTVTETTVTTLTDTMIRYGLNDASEEEERRRPRRLDANRLLTADIENLALRLLCYTKNVPDTGPLRDPKMISFTHLKSMPMPTLCLPMPVPISAVFDEFNKRTTPDRWSNFCVNTYTNTSPLEEMISYLATLGVSAFKIYSGVDTFLIVDVCVSSSTRYNLSLNSPHLHLVLVGETATSKSYIYKIVRKLAIPGIVMGTNEGSSKQDKTHTNMNGQIDVRDEAPDFFTINPDKAGGRNSKQTADLENWKQQADAGVIDYTYLDSSDPTGNTNKTARNAKQLLFRKKGLAISLCNGVMLYSMNKGVDLMQNAARERMMVLNPPINSDNGKSLPGSQLSDYALRNIDAFANLKPIAMRSRHSWITMMHLYSRLNPRFAPDVYDVTNLMGQVLRTAKQFLPRNIHETRMYGRFWAFLTELTFMHAHHMVVRDDMDNQAKYAPCTHSSSYLSLRHLSVEEFMSRASKYLYATKGMAILTLTLLKDILESPIRTAILEFLAEKCYPDGNVNHTTFKKVDPNGGVKKKKGGGGGGGYQGNNDPADEEPIRTDFNTVVWPSTFTDKETLCRELGKKIGGHVSYSTEQVRYVLSSMMAETIDIAATEDYNRREYPVKVVGYETRAPSTKNKKNGKRAGNQRRPTGAAVSNKKRAMASPTDSAKQSARILRENPEMAEELRKHAGGIIDAIMADGGDKSNDALASDAMDVDGAATTAINGAVDAAISAAYTDDDIGDPEDEDRKVADEMQRRREDEESLAKWGNVTLCKPNETQFTRSVVSLQRTAVDGGSVSAFWHIHVPHHLLRKYYRAKTDGKETTVDPFHRSHIWKAFARTLQNNVLEKYPAFITDAIVNNPNAEFSPNGKEYFAGGVYTYLTGRTDATNSKAEEYINAAQEELNAAFDANKVKPVDRRQLPHFMPTRWPAKSPALKRNKRITHLSLPCIIDDSDLDKAYIYGAAANYDEPRSIERLEYDVDYISMLRRCIRLGIDVKENWKNLPIVCQVRKSMNGPMYPESSWKMSIDGMKRSILRDIATGRHMRTNLTAGGWGGRQEGGEEADGAVDSDSDDANGSDSEEENDDYADNQEQDIGLDLLRKGARVTGATTSTTTFSTVAPKRTAVKGKKTGTAHASPVSAIPPAVLAVDRPPSSLRQFAASAKTKVAVEMDADFDNIDSVRAVLPKSKKQKTRDQ